MNLAFFSDLHANLPAMRAALADAERRGAEACYCGGDVVGDGPFPSETVALLRKRGIPTIRGNVDRKVVALAAKGRDELRAFAERGGKKATLAWSALRLDAADLDWLSRLPASLEIAAERATVMLVHGSPLGDTDYIFPSINAVGLSAKLGDARPEALVAGHSHVPFVHTVLGVLVVNCGSVGRPVDGDPRGAYALLDVQGSKVRARIVRFVYPFEEVVAAVRARAMAGVDPDEYRGGVKLKDA